MQSTVEGDTMERTHDYLLALGRVLMSGLFVWGGYGKLMAPGATLNTADPEHGSPALSVPERSIVYGPPAVMPPVTNSIDWALSIMTLPL